MKKMSIIITILLGLIVMAGCSLPFIGGSKAAVPANAANPQGQFDPAKMPVEQKLGYAILKMEGTPNAISADQAKTMLPLWQALKSLSTNANTTDTEINALYGQMKDTLNPAQTAEIEKISWTQSDLQALAAKYGIQFAQGGPGRSGTPAGTPSAQRETQIAAFRQQNGGAGGKAAAVLAAPADSRVLREGLRGRVARPAARVERRCPGKRTRAAAWVG